MAESLDSESSDNNFFPNSENIVENSSITDNGCAPSMSLEGSVVGSPSIESFSTLPDGESSLSLADAATDLVVRVDSPQKQADLLETYITFRVSTRTSREGFEAPAYSVRRRYNDFIWLRQHLVEAYPTHFVPPLPLKHSIIGQFDRYGREFVTTRMAALQMFLNRVANHPILSFTPCFKCFLTANSEEFQDLRRLTASSILTKVSDIGKSLSTLHIEAQRPHELNRFHAYLMELSDKLNYLSRINLRIRRERIEYAKGMKELKPGLEGWAGADSDLTDDLCAVAGAVDKCEQGLHSVLLDTENFIIVQPLKEYCLYVDAVRETLNRRDELETELLYRQELLEKKKDERDVVQEEGLEGVGFRAWMKTFESKEERLEKQNQAVNAALAAMENSKDKLECANENIRSDTERWTKEKQMDLKHILVTFADQHISYYELCGNAWEEVVSSLQRTRKSDNSASS